MTLEEILQSDVPWEQKRQQLVAFPYAPAPPKPAFEDLDVGDWDLPAPDSFAALANAVPRGLLTMEEYRQVANAVGPEWHGAST